MIEWRTIPSFPLYEASDEGTIRRRREFARYSNKGDPLKAHLSKHTGYLQVSLGLGTGRSFIAQVHVLACEAFHGPRPSPRHEVAHWDGVRHNARPGNLRWATVGENEDDKLRHGTRSRGETSGKSKLSDEQVREIRAVWPTLPRSSTGKRIANGATRDLEKRYGVTRSNLEKIAQSKHWRHI